MLYLSQTLTLFYINFSDLTPFSILILKFLYEGLHFRDHLHKIFPYLPLSLKIGFNTSWKLNL